MQNKQSPSGYRHIVPATSAQTYVPISPYHLPQAALPPFETPPASPFSQPVHNYNGQPLFKLPPPMQPLSPNLIHQQNSSPIQSSHSRNERILLNQSNSPTVFPMSMAPPPANILLENSPTIQPTMHHMQHNTSVIHSLTSHHRSSIPSDKPLTTADQRELARKVSHSAIERRRRERINDKIMQLKELIPSCADQDHLNKLSILQSSIEYIEYLQDLVVTYRQREKDGGRTNDNGSSENGRKRSKFDRYDILPSSKLSSRRFETPEDKEYKHKGSSSDQLMDSVVNTEVNSDNTDSTSKADISDLTPMLIDQEEADVLSPKSISTVQEPKTIIKSTSTIQESKKIITTRNSETQTSPIHDWEKSVKALKDVQETQASLSYECESSEESEIVQESDKSPRGGMTVQQLLC